MEPLVLDLALLESSLDDTGLPGIPAGLPAPALRRALATALRVSEQCTKAEARAASEAGAVYPIVTRTRVATPRPSQG